MQRYKVTCTSCGQNDVVTIDERQHLPKMYDKFARTPFTSFRYRPDEKYGWQCSCGNYDLLADQEKKHWKDLVTGDSLRLEQIAKMLSEPKLRFKMEKL